MKPVSIKGYRKKQIRKLVKEKDSLYKQQQALGYKELEKPIRHGWYLELIILPQIERYKFKPEIEEVVKKLEKRHWGLTKEKAQKKWDNSVSKYLIYRDIPTLSPKSYRKLSDKAKRHCRIFFFKENNKWKRRYYLRIPKNAYKISFRRAYTTHSKIIDPSIEERLDLIEQQLMKEGWYNITTEYWSYRCRWQVDKIKKSRKKMRSELTKYKFASQKEIKEHYKWERN